MSLEHFGGFLFCPSLIALNSVGNEARDVPRLLCSSQETADLVTFTEEILNRKFHFLCNVMIEGRWLFLQKCSSWMFDWVLKRSLRWCILRNLKAVF